MADIKYAYYLSSVGYKIVGKTDNDIIVAGGGTKTVASFWHDGNFTPADYVPKTRTITINGVAKDLSANATFTTPDTVTRIKGGAAGTSQTIDGSGNVSIPITAVPASLLTGTATISTTGSAAKLTTARTIDATGDGTWSVTFDGSANVSGALTLSNSGVTAGTYNKVTVDAKGRVTAGTNDVNSYSTTISGTATVTHNLGTTAVHVTMVDTVTKYKVDDRIKMTDATKIDIEFDSTPPNTIAVTVTKANL